MSKTLPDRPNLEHLRSQAKSLLSSFRSGSSEAASRFAVLGVLGRPAALHDAQLVIAREYGFESWPKLVRHVEEENARAGITDEVAARFVDLFLSPQVGRAARLLELYPSLPSYNLETALAYGNFDYVARVGPEVGLKLGKRQWTPFEYVCYSKIHHLVPAQYEPMLELARYFLDHGADPNTTHPEEEPGSPPLSVLYGACGETFHVGIAKLLLERGANPNDNESTYHAAQLNQREILQLLVDHGANISDRQQPWNNTPLYFLCGHRPSDNNYEVAVNGIEWLLEHGADPNVTAYKENVTPLHAAASLGGTRLVDMLLAHGADPNAKRADGRTPYELALITGNDYAAKAMEAKGANKGVVPEIAALASCVSGTALAGDYQLKDELVGFAFVRAAELGNEQVVRSMLGSKISPNLSDGHGYTPLHFAAYTGRDSIVGLLLASGANLESRDETYNATPLGWALHGFAFNRNRRGNYPAVVKSLLAAGADKKELQDFFENDHASEECRAEMAEAVKE